MGYDIAVVDDDPDYLEIMRRSLEGLGYHDVHLEADPLRLASTVQGGRHFDLAIIDLNMPELSGLELLERVRHTSPGTECIIVTAVDQARIAVDCLRQGAYDYLVKPVPPEVLQLALRRALERKRLLDLLEVGRGHSSPALDHPEPFAPMVTRSAAMMRVLREAELHAVSSVPILITGASGTGKELLARAIHAASPRASQAFTPINMASLTSTLFEAEFFGHARGAFTDARAERKGHLQHTDRGTLFLDEIGALSAELQAKLLRVLQDGEYSRLGSSRRRRVDLRIIAATNEDLDAMMAAGAFRKDLYYRIRGGRLHLPPLRERTEDIPLLIHRFLGSSAERKAPPRVTPEALDRLLAHDYPGNVRELESMIRSAANLAQGDAIDTNHLPAELRRAVEVGPPPTADHPGGSTSLAAVEKAHILMTYERLGKNKSATARALSIGLNTLRRRLASYGVA